MGGQEINIIVTVKSLEELVFQVAPIPKTKLEQLGSLKTGRVFVKSHVECETCSNNMEVNFFWTQAMTMSEGMVMKASDEIKEEVVEIDADVKMEEFDVEEYETEYLIEEIEELEVGEMKQEAETIEIIDDDDETTASEPPKKSPKKTRTSRKKRKIRVNNKFKIPDNDFVKKVEKNGICDYCDYKRKRHNCVMSRTNFFGHCASHLITKDGKNFNCRACGFPSFTINDARHHALTCEEREMYKEQWKKEQKEAHSVEEKPIIVESSDTTIKTATKKYPREKVLCHICSQYINKNSMEDHLLRHETGTSSPYTCNECNKNFSTREVLRKHLICTHFPEMAQYKCTKCPAVFVQKHFYETHQMAKHQIGNVEKVTCVLCGIIVANERNLREHNFNAHTDPSLKKKFQCLHCSKVFYDKRHFKAHSLIHVPEHELPFKCEICGKGFVNSYKWKQHVLEHKDPEAILKKCPICGRGYKYANSLKVHMRVHTGEQPYECKFCQRRFSDRSHHRVHMKNHESEMGIKLTLTAEERRLVNHGVYKPEDLVSQVLLE